MDEEHIMTAEEFLEWLDNLDTSEEDDGRTATA